MSILFKLYGYKVDDGDLPSEMREVTICVDISQAEALSEFFARCAEKMRSNPAWEHEHFSGDGRRDIVVYNFAKLEDL